jgi:hypothetical protein
VSWNGPANSEALREAQTALAHVNRVATMGQLAASIAHEIKQPLAGAITNAEAGLGWLARQPPNVEKACNSLAHHDRPPFSGRPSLTGHCGHCWTCSLPSPVAHDPERKSQRSHRSCGAFVQISYVQLLSRRTIVSYEPVTQKGRYYDGPLFNLVP